MSFEQLVNTLYQEKTPLKRSKVIPFSLRGVHPLASGAKNRYRARLFRRILVSCLFVGAGFGVLLFFQFTRGRFRVSDTLSDRVSISLPKQVYASTELVQVKIVTNRPDKIKTAVVDVKGKEIGIITEKEVKGGEVTVKIKPPVAFIPGKYTLRVTLNGKDYAQDFSWGVLAINTNKSIYLPNEAAKLSLAVLDEKGMMVCDAMVKLKIKNEKSKIDDELSTDNGKIVVNPECKLKDYTEKPDYEAAYQVGGVGKYEMTLTSTTKNGTYAITDSFEVKESVPFDVERISATRIYPVYKYPVLFKITANRDFTGQIVETVPYSFETSSDNATGKPYDYMSFDKQEVASYKTNRLIWNVSLKSGETIMLSYKYDSPDESPYFFLLGQLQFYRTKGIVKDSISDKAALIFEEQRHWQIAVDVVTDYTQSGYRFFANVDSANVGLPLNPYNSMVRLSSSGASFRLRSLLHIGGLNLGISGQDFKLQFAGKGTGTCDAPSGGIPSSWTDVTLGGFNWNTETAAATWSTRYQHKSVVFNNKLWVFSGFDGSSPDPADVYSSPDGTTWTLETSSPGWTGRDAFGAVVFNNKIWIMGGFDGVTTRNNEVWSSSDGVNWTEETVHAGWTARNNFDLIVYHGKMWVIGGYIGSGNGLNDVYYSSDGINWTQATAGASWPARQLVRATVLNDKMWVMSGVGATNYNDVWYSTDGANWTQATGNAGWTARRGDAIITAGNTMYLIGGWNGTTAYNDVWYSSDGANWYKSTSAARWSVRSYMTLGFLNNKIYFMGGLLNTNSTRYHDVYSTYLTEIGFHANNSTASPSAMTTNTNDPNHSSDTTVSQTYTEENNFTNSQGAINIGQDGLWDFALRDNFATLHTRYCMRIVKSTGTALDVYSYYPEVYTGPDIEPRVKGNLRIQGGVRVGN